MQPTSGSEAPQGSLIHLPQSAVRFMQMPEGPKHQRKKSKRDPRRNGKKNSGNQAFKAN